MATPDVKPTRSVIYYIGKDRFIYQYKFKVDNNACVMRWHCIRQWVNDDSAVASDGDRLVIVGGRSLGAGDKRAVSIDMKDNPIETQLPDLPEPRYGSGVVLSNNDVFVVGGYNRTSRHLRSVYYLSLGSDAWQAKKSMPLAVSNPLVILHKQCIYVLGGQGVDYSRQCSVLKYNIEDDTWKRCMDMLVLCDSHVAGVVVHEGRIKVLTVDKCITYADDINTWSDIKRHSKLGDKVHAFVRSGQICAAVQNGDTYSMMSYDDKDKVWETEHERIDQAWRAKLFC